MKRHLILLASLVAFALLAAAAPASAQIGVRAGVSADPDQFYFGAHVESAPIVEHLRFRPNVEFGVGDDVTLVALNFEFAYSLPLRALRRQPWRVYVGGGPAANIYSFDDRRGGGTDVEPGFNILIGIQHTRGLFAEFKIGTINSPDVKFAVGYVFR
jgi:hypothetical protein